MYDNVFETKEIKISTKDKIEQQHVQITDIDLSSIETRLFFEDSCVMQINGIFLSITR